MESDGGSFQCIRLWTAYGGQDELPVRPALLPNTVLWKSGRGQQVEALSQKHGDSKEHVSAAIYI